MKLISMEINNYRQYNGLQKIELATDAKKSFNIIQGANGAGKTNFFRALLWCLYGDEIGLEDRKYREENKILGILNEKRLKETPSGETIKVSIKIVLGETQSEYIIERFILFKKNRNGTIERVDSSFTIMKREVGGFKLIDEPELYINRIVPPKEIRDFFFFDGERLDKFFRPGSGISIKKTIIDVSQIGLIEKMTEHMEKIRKSIMREHSDLSPDIKRLQEDMNGISKTLEEKRNISEELNRDIQETSSRISEIEDYLREHPIALIKEHQSRRDELKRQNKELYDSINEAVEERNNILISILPSVFLMDECENLIKEIDNIDKKDGLPPDVRSSFIDKLLKNGVCICGASLKKGSKEELLVRSLLGKNSHGDNSKLLLEGRAEISELLKSFDQKSERLRNVNKRIMKMERDLKTNDEKLSEISDVLKVVQSDEEVSKKESLKNALSIEMQNTMVNMRKEQDDISFLEMRDREMNKQLGNLITKQSANRELSGQIKLLSDAVELANYIKDGIASEARKKVEDKTEEYFFNLIWNKERFDKIRIDDDYNISVIDSYGHECLGSLSAGQRQVLALAFMAALKEISGFDMPVIIDTPLGRISGEPRDNIAKNLPDYLKNTQVTLLVTDTEYTDSFREKLKLRLGKEFVIKYNKSTGEARVDIK